MNAFSACTVRLLTRYCLLFYLIFIPVIGLALLVGHILPHAQQIAYIMADSSQEYYVGLVDVNRGVSATIARYPARVSDPAWSPDGTTLMYQVNFPNRLEQVMFNIETHHETHQPRAARANSESGGGDVLWSPDHRRYIYQVMVSSAPPPYITLFMMETSQEQTPAAPQRLTYIPHTSYQANWSPDSQHITFVTVWDGNSDIYSMAVYDQTSLRRLTFNPGDELNPVWSLDQVHIAFTSDQDGGDLYMLDASTLRVRRLTFDMGIPSGYAWQPAH